METETDRDRQAGRQRERVPHLGLQSICRIIEVR